MKNTAHQIAASLGLVGESFGLEIIGPDQFADVGAETAWFTRPNWTNLTSVAQPVISTNPCIFFRLVYP